MPHARPFTVCLLVKSNSIGIDHVRMELTANVRKRLRTYQALITKHDLMHLSVTDIPVTWMKDGEPAVEHANSSSKIFSWIEILDGYLFIWGSFPHATQASGELSQYTHVEASWNHGQTSWLINELPSHANAMREIWDSGLAGTSAGELDNEALVTAVELRMQITRQSLAHHSAPTHPQRWPEPFAQFPAHSAGETYPTALLPQSFVSVMRSAVADGILNRLLQQATQHYLSPNTRFGLLTLASALLICPDEVSLTTLSNADLPVFLRRKETTFAEKPLTADYLSEEHTEVFIRYQTLRGVLTRGYRREEWFTVVTLHEPNLELLYEDQVRNERARKMLVDTLGAGKNDLQLLNFLALAMTDLLRVPSVDARSKHELKISQLLGIDGSINGESPRDDSKALWEEFTGYPGIDPAFAMLPQSNWGLWGREHLRARILVPKHACLLLALQDVPDGSERLIPLIQQWAQTHQIFTVLIQDTEEVVRRIGLELLRLLHAEMVDGNTFVSFEDLRVVLGAGKSNAIVHCGMAVVTVAQGAEKALSLALSQLGISDSKPIEAVFPQASGTLMTCAMGRKGDERSKMFEHFRVACKILKQACARLPEIDALYVPILDGDLCDEVRIIVLLTGQANFREAGVQQ